MDIAPTASPPSGGSPNKPKQTPKDKNEDGKQASHCVGEDKVECN